MTFSSKTFKYFIDDKIQFSCRLKSIKCEAKNTNGHQCKKQSVIGTPLCWIHLLHQKHLRIKPSRYGQGLFASDPKKGENAVVFRRGQTIIEYGGDVIDETELIRRYDGFTAPYGVGIGSRNGDNIYKDGACNRGIGGLANHRSASQRPNAHFGFTRNNVLVLIADEPIKNNREIFINYNKGHKGRRYNFNEAGIDYSTK
jgi:hypothetical protein